MDQKIDPRAICGIFIVVKVVLVPLLHQASVELMKVEIEIDK